MTAECVAKQSLRLLTSALRSYASKDRATTLKRFFKTGRGEYGEGDQFLGITVPSIRSIVKQYKEIAIDDVLMLLTSAWHEERLCALLLLVEKFESGSQKERKHIFNAYMRSTKWINNWDLVDLSAPKIVGEYLQHSSRHILYTFAASSNMWKRRIAILATFAFIKRHAFNDTIQLSRLLLHDTHDLIHKAVGWMLREVGKRDSHELESFLQANYKTMPRTMLRYAIERLPKNRKIAYLRGTV